MIYGAIALALKDLDAEKKRLEAIQGFTRLMTANYWHKQFS